MTIAGSSERSDIAARSLLRVARCAAKAAAHNVARPKAAAPVVFADQPSVTIAQ